MVSNRAGRAGLALGLCWAFRRVVLPLLIPALSHDGPPIPDDENVSIQSGNLKDDGAAPSKTYASLHAIARSQSAQMTTSFHVDSICVGFERHLYLADF
ncbi:hypothetical protein F5Y14DRAFT_452228 [Nemania sp. NC0429]|nr:hypothetical protein F5Y14DRAFT_452228 [Nemania sp. NC0429]